MKSKLILSFVIGGTVGILFELLWIWHGKIYLTHSPHSVVSMIMTAFLEGAFLLLILTWRGRIRFHRIIKNYLLYLVFLVVYYFIREITVTLSLFISILPSALFGVMISKLTGLEVSMEVVGTGFTVLIDVALLLLVFYPLLTLGNKWAEKGLRHETS
jgi:hypothetical protein